MIKNKKLLAIIPARKNSKRILGKNLASLNGKPLVCHTIEEALKNKYIDKLIVTTDDPKISKVSKNYGIHVDKLRPSYLSKDNSKTIDIISYEIIKLQKKKEFYDYIMLLQPTSPFRTNKNIDSAISLLIKKKAECITSVCETEHPIEWCGKLSKENSMENFLSKKVNGKRSQDFKKSYRINGAIYIAKIDDVLKKNTLLLNNKKSYAYIMDRYESIDIDNEIDLEFANYISRKKYAK